MRLQYPDILYWNGAVRNRMKITFSQSYLSINSFPETFVPDFTLITGPNGAGKSHFLQALRLGNIRSDCAPAQGPQNQNEIRLFDWSNLVPQDTGYFTSEQIRNEKMNMFQNLHNIRQNISLLEPLRNFARQHNLPQKYISDPGSVSNLELEELRDTLGVDNQNIDSIFQNLKSITAKANQNLLNHIGDVGMKSGLISIAEYSGKSLISLSEKDIISPYLPTWGQADLFQQQFARLFVAYRDMYLSNQLAQYRASKGHLDAEPVSDEDFLAIRGPAPWDFVNQSLAEANLDFRINAPNLDDFTQYQPQLTKLSSGVVIPFGNLSSGEKVLMSFAFCVYYASDRRQISTYPKILLLDEVDAPLHPSMSKNLINTITKTMVGSFGIKVIATTHSPSTVALTPEDAIYTMHPNKPGLHKTNKSEALAILTDGVPTLSISYDGRRQVFVESLADAETYDDIYRLYKTQIGSERSLEFVGTGKKVAGGSEQNSGCDIVKNLVDRLEKAGNNSVYGLLDWDGHHQKSRRIAVLAEGRRNGLENVVFDPLLIALVICRDCPDVKNRIGIDESIGFIDLCNFSSDKLQLIVKNVCRVVLESEATEEEKSYYMSGLELRVDKRWFKVDDHKLEGMIIDAFPELRSVTKQQAGKLMQHIVKRVLLDKRDYAPIEIFDVIKDLLERN